MVPTGLTHWMVVRAGRTRCAFPIAHAIETLRPLPVRSLPGLPPSIAGVAVVRGSATPVIDLDRLLGGPGDPGTRWLTVRAATRQVAFAVAEVVGARRIDADRLAPLPPLTALAGESGVDAVTMDDAELMLVLAATRTVPAEAWSRIDRDATAEPEGGP